MVGLLLGLKAKIWELLLLNIKGFFFLLISRSEM